LKEEKFITDKLIETTDETISTGQGLADKIAKFGGSWSFIVVFLILLSVWILVNSFFPAARFDPFPFILMNLFLSTIAALQAPVILMSQNRKEEKDRRRAENDYMINLKAEIEIRSLHQKMELLLGEGMKTLYESQAHQLSLLKEIETRLSKTGTSGGANNASS
ncbi:MAG TPA: DUF1003 domain-containing protein, partial [Saprospiraceae bacterium]|nr:DUF1003 domain-containing protein [Saprospiraceae bacterium]